MLNQIHISLSNILIGIIFNLLLFLTLILGKVSKLTGCFQHLILTRCWKQGNTVYRRT